MSVFSFYVTFGHNAVFNLYNDVLVPAGFTFSSGVDRLRLTAEPLFPERAVGARIFDEVVISSDYTMIIDASDPHTGNPLT